MSHAPIKKILICCGCLALIGCLGIKPFQPPPDDYQAWMKSGASEQDLKMALLECGYPSPYNSGKYNFSLEEFVAANRCMETSGFNDISDRGWRWACQKQTESAEDICGVTPIRMRSVERRVGSGFCSDFPESTICVPR